MSQTHQIIELPRIHDPRGNLSYIQGGQQIPFEVKRSYWIYDVPGGEVRGAHASMDVEEFIVALSGSYKSLGLDDLAPFLDRDLYESIMSTGRE